MSVKNTESGVLRVVPTKINTTLSDWTAMLVEEIKTRNIDASRITKLDAKHAWENENTPYGYAVIIQHMNDRAIRAADMKRHNPVVK